MAHKINHEFTFEAPHARSVAVAGTFNGWNSEACPMRRENSGPWKAKVALNPGRHQYRFIVDSKWVSDPSAKQSEANEFGETNSVVVVVEQPPPPPKVTAARRWWLPWTSKPSKQNSDASLLHAARNKIFGVLTPRMEFPSSRITDRKGRGMAR